RRRSEGALTQAEGPSRSETGSRDACGKSRRLRYFVAVAEELSFVRASQRLHIAPPALSRAISELEAHLGVKLFDRSSRHVALTEAGSALLPDVRRALQDLDAATSRIQRLGGRERRLTVAYKSDMDG